MNKLKLILIIFLTISVRGLSQSQEGENSGLAVLARARKSKILLRWAPKKAVDWQLLNKYGYRLERYTIVRDSMVLNTPERATLESSEKIMPKPLPSWKEMVEQDDYAAIAAQAIYGETFEIDMADRTYLMQIVHKAQESEARFSYALFATDQSFDVALMAGLAYVDSTARKNEKYLYRVYSNVPAHIEKIEFGFVYTGLEDYSPLPKPLGLQATFGDKTVALKWERENFDHIYNSWWVERSSDGKTFRRVTDKPLINTINYDEGRGSRYMYKIDSLSDNGKKYYYRVRGVTSFGEEGPPSDTVSGFGKKQIEYAPAITGTKVIDNMKVEITWTFPAEGVEQISGFKIERSNRTDGPFEVIGSFSSNVYETIDDEPLATNYYRATAFNRYGVETTSFPVLAQLLDSIPPEIPVDLEGEVDTLGRVTISWQPNTEKDLLGYRIYRSNFKNSEFSQITSEAVTEPSFTDSISINTLTGSVYYKVLAVDLHHNPSELSQALLLNRPDIIPPVPPVFTGVKSGEKGVILQWVRSSSDDVKAHHLYRRQQNSLEWTLIKTFEDSTTIFTDSALQPTTSYQYALVATDRSNLASKPCKPVWGKLIDSGIKPEIKAFTADVDRGANRIILHWKYDHQGVYKYNIYRAKADEPISLYKVVNAESLFYNDSQLDPQTEYIYRVKAIYHDGGESPFSKELNIHY